MPGDHGLGLYNNWRAIPARPESSQEDPEKATLVAEPKPLLFPLIGSELLSQGGVFQREGGVRQEGGPEDAEQGV